MIEADKKGACIIVFGSRSFDCMKLNGDLESLANGTKNRDKTNHARIGSVDSPCSSWLQPDNQPLPEHADRLRDARQFGAVVRVEQAADFLLIDA